MQREEGKYHVVGPEVGVRKEEIDGENPGKF